MPDNPARRSLRFRVLERFVGWALVRMSKLARDANDLHEIRHLLAQMKADESVDCGPDCPLRVMTTRAR